MEQENNIVEPEVDRQPQVMPEETQDNGTTPVAGAVNIRRNHRLIVAGCILTVLAWCMVWLDWATPVLCTGALVCLFAGIRIPRGAHRNLGITAIIAAMVLLVVYLGIWITLACI